MQSKRQATGWLALCVPHSPHVAVAAADAASEPFADLEVCLTFFHLLDVGSLGRSSAVAPKWNEYARSDTIWKDRVKARFPGSSRAQKFGFACDSMMLLYRQRHLLEIASRSLRRWTGHIDEYALIVELYEDDKVIFADALSLDRCEDDLTLHCFRSFSGSLIVACPVNEGRTPTSVRDVMNLELSLFVARRSDSKCMVLCTKARQAWHCTKNVAFQVGMHVIDTDVICDENGFRLNEPFDTSVWFYMRLEDIHWRTPGLKPVGRLAIPRGAIEILSLWRSYGTWL